MAIEARTSRGYWVRIGIVAAIFGPIAMFGLVGAIGAVVSPRSHGPGGAIGELVLAVVMSAPVVFLLTRRGSWPQWFDERGVTLRNGRRFDWNDLERVVEVRFRRYGRGR